MKNNAIVEHKTHCELIEKYATFVASDIEAVLLEILATVEGTQFEIQDMPVASGFEHEYSSFLQNYKTIIRKENKNLAIDEMIGLPENREGFISFYRYVNEVGSVVFGLSLPESLAYLKEFIDGVIAYKVANQVENISVDALQQLKEQFLKSHLFQDEKNSEKRKRTLD